MTPQQPILFGPFSLDTANECLWRGTQAICLTPKIFAVLRYLVEHPGQLVTKEELLGAVWSDTYVSDAALKVCVRRTREALNDNPKAPRFIETVQRRGYRFIGKVSSQQSAVSSQQSVVSGQQSAVSGQKQSSVQRLASSVQDHQHPTPPLVGREAELAHLQDCWERAFQGKRQIVFVTGEAGVGKTAVVDTFVDRLLAASHPLVVRGQCVEHYGAGETYLPLLEALGRLCRQPRQERVLSVLSRYAPTWLAQMPWLVNDAEQDRLRQWLAGATRERMLREIAEALEALTAEAPLVLILEDLQWSDYSTLDCLSFLARRREPAQLLVIGTYRSAEAGETGHPLQTIKQELQVHRRCQELRLECLSEEAVVEYVLQRFRPAHSPHLQGEKGTVPSVAVLRPFAQIIHQHTDGNPLFMTNVLDHLATQGVIGRNNGQWTLQRDARTITFEMPESLRQMIKTQVERLSRDNQHVLEAASVAGMEFTAAAVAAGLAMNALQVEEQCEALAQRNQFLRAKGDFEWPDGTVTARYEFVHALYQQALYERVPVGKRVYLHQRIGERQEAGYGNQAYEIAAELALHFERGHAYRKAVQYLYRAAKNAMRRCGYREAIDRLRKGLALLQALPETPERGQQEIALLLALGVSLIATKGYAATEVQEVYTRALKLVGHQLNFDRSIPVMPAQAGIQRFHAQASGKRAWIPAFAGMTPPQSTPQSDGTLGRQAAVTPQLYWAVWGLQSFHLMRAELPTAHELGEQLFNLARRLQDPEFLGVAHYMLGITLASRGGLSAARTHLEQGIALCDSQPHLRLRIACLSFAPRVLWGLGYPDQALAASQEAVSLSEALSHPFTSVMTQGLTAILHVIRREERVAQQHAEAAMVLAEEHGFADWRAQALILRGWTFVAQKREQEGISLMRQGLDAYLSTGAELGRPMFLGLLADAYEKTGHTEEGLAVVNEALTATRTNGQRVQESWMWWLKGKLMLQKLQVTSAKLQDANPQSLTPNPRSEAEECFHQALTLSRELGAKSLELRIATSLSRLWQQQGKQAEAQQMLAEIYGWFTEGFDTADLTEARELLEELTEVTSIQKPEARSQE